MKPPALSSLIPSPGQSELRFQGRRKYMHICIKGFDGPIGDRHANFYKMPALLFAVPTERRGREDGVWVRDRPSKAPVPVHFWWARRDCSNRHTAEDHAP